MAMEIKQSEYRRIEAHGAEIYPNECQGFLLGRQEDGRAEVLDIYRLTNVWATSGVNPFEVRPEDSTRNRTLVDPKDYLKADREARERGMDIIGYYHSHPDHPAQPSEFDRKHAHPFLIYVILAVEQGVPRQMIGWLLSEDQTRFLPEEIIIQESI